MKKIIYGFYQFYRLIYGKAKIYHRGESKRKIIIFLDLINWLIKEKEVNKLYYALGLNQREVKQANYIGKASYLHIKRIGDNCLKKKNDCSDFNYDILTKDKFYCSSILKANGMKPVDYIGLVSNKTVILSNGVVTDYNYLRNLDGELLFKNCTIEAGEGILLFNFSNGSVISNGVIINWDNFLNLIKKGKWLIQRKISSHKSIRKINNTALNTTRIVTIIDGTQPIFLCGFQAFATGNAFIDSWSHGSVYVGINPETGCLRKDAYHNLDNHEHAIAYKHPDSNILFEDYEIPFLKEAIALCIKAHEIFYSNFILGWDVAITDDGPLILEINEKPGMNVVQCVDGGLRNKIEYCLNKQLKTKKD